MELPELFIHDRDTRMWEARKQGANYREIAKMFGVSPSTAFNGVKRAGDKERERYAAENPNAGWLVLERYETMLKHLIPFTKSTQMDDGNGGKIQIPPSYDAIDRVVKIQTQLVNLLGLQNDTIQLEVTQKNAPQIDDGKDGGELSPEAFAKQALAELIRAGALQGPDADILQSLMDDPNILEAEVVSDTRDHSIPQLEVEAGVPSLVARDREDQPEWIDDDYEDYEPGVWVPDNITDVVEEE